MFALIFLSSITTTQGSLFRKARDDPTRRRRSRSNHVRRSRRSRQLFSIPTNRLTSDIDVDQPLASMANVIHLMLQHSLNEFASSNNTVSLTDDLGGLHLPIAQDVDPCTLAGKVLFTTSRVKGLNQAFHAHSLELIPGTEDYEPIVDSGGRTNGYKWNGVWQVTASIDSFKVDVITQVDVDVCGRPLDFTAFGGLLVNGTTISARVFVDGELSNDLSKGDLHIESAELLSQDVHFDVITSMTSLTRHLPLNYDGEMYTLVEHLLSRNLQPFISGDDGEAQN